MTDWNKLIDDVYSAGVEANAAGLSHESAEIAYDVYMALLTPVTILEAENSRLGADLDACEKAYKETRAKEEMTTIEPDEYEGIGTFVICKRCRTVLPLEMTKYVWSYCPACGRKISRGNK